MRMMHKLSLGSSSQRGVRSSLKELQGGGSRPGALRKPQAGALRLPGPGSAIYKLRDLGN